MGIDRKLLMLQPTALQTRTTKRVWIKYRAISLCISRIPQIFPIITLSRIIQDIFKAMWFLKIIRSLKLIRKNLSMPLLNFCSINKVLSLISKNYKKISLIKTILMRLYKIISIINRFNKIIFYSNRINKYQIEIILSLLDVHQKDSKLVL